VNYLLLVGESSGPITDAREPGRYRYEISSLARYIWSATSGAGKRTRSETLKEISFSGVIFISAAKLVYSSWP